MKILIAAALTAAALVTAPAAQAFTADELEFLRDVSSVGITNTEGRAGIVDSGWQVCDILSQGYSRNWVARQVYLGSQEANGAAGITYSGAQALVYYANADLCPGGGSSA